MNIDDFTDLTDLMLKRLLSNLSVETLPPYLINESIRMFILIGEVRKAVIANVTAVNASATEPTENDKFQTYLNDFCRWLLVGGAASDEGFFLDYSNSEKIRKDLNDYYCWLLAGDVASDERFFLGYSNREKIIEIIIRCLSAYGADRDEGSFLDYLANEKANEKLIEIIISQEDPTRLWGDKYKVLGTERLENELGTAYAAAVDSILGSDYSTGKSDKYREIEDKTKVAQLLHKSFPGISITSEIQLFFKNLDDHQRRDLFKVMSACVNSGTPLSDALYHNLFEYINDRPKIKKGAYEGLLNLAKEGLLTEESLVLFKSDPDAFKTSEISKREGYCFRNKLEKVLNKKNYPSAPLTNGIWRNSSIEHASPYGPGPQARRLR